MFTHRSGRGSKGTARYHQRPPHNFSCWYVLPHQHGFHQSHTCQHGHALDSESWLQQGKAASTLWYLCLNGGVNPEMGALSHCWSSSALCFQSETTIRQHVRCIRSSSVAGKQPPLHEPLPHDGNLMVEVRQSVKLAVSVEATQLPDLSKATQGNQLTSTDSAGRESNQLVGLREHLNRKP